MCGIISTRCLLAEEKLTFLKAMEVAAATASVNEVF